ncbi:MAG: cation:proton antiporter [Gemmatimonadales bacterium]
MMSLSTLLLQIAVIIICSRAIGLLFRRIGQPQVVGEMAAGIVLGPSVLGALAPELSASLFPAASLGPLNALSQVGLIAFMFLVGLELDPRQMRGRGHTAVLTSHVSIVVPFCLGTVLALFLYPRLSDDSVTFTNFALFIGTAMSITAFPVLARILTERQLLRHPVGAVALASAAVDDVTAWCILAAVVAAVRASEAVLPLWVTIGGSVLYVGLMLLVARPALSILERRFRAAGRVTQDLLGVTLLLVLASAWTTEHLGIHALFGAFMVGAILPREPGFVHAVTERVEDLVVVLLLPLFFAFSGLRTSIALVDGPAAWLMTALIIVVAVAGKFGGSMVAARAGGMRWREAGAIGALMNTRGLMELVVLNIGLDIGVISPALFTMMVLMALVTTLMARPLLELIYPARQFAQETPGASAAGLTPAPAATGPA